MKLIDKYLEYLREDDNKNDSDEKPFFDYKKITQIPPKTIISKASSIAKGVVTKSGSKGISLGLLRSLLILVPWGIYRAVRSSLDVCVKQCGTFKFNDNSRQLCLYRCKLAALEEAVKISKSSLSKTKNPRDIKRIQIMLSRQEKELEVVRKEVLNYLNYQNPK